jgi:hypothetical protein
LNSFAEEYCGVAAQRYRFFQYWTLKESYIKARGMGLSIPLDQFSFQLEANQPIRITFDPRLNDNPGHWQFAQFRLNGFHLSHQLGFVVAHHLGEEREIPLVGIFVRPVPLMADGLDCHVGRRNNVALIKDAHRRDEDEDEEEEVEEEEVEAINERVKVQVEESVQFAEESPWPDESELLKDVYIDKDYPFIVD